MLANEQKQMMAIEESLSALTFHKKPVLIGHGPNRESSRRSKAGMKQSMPDLKSFLVWTKGSDIHLNKNVFTAIAVITQIGIRYGNAQLFQVRGYKTQTL